MVSVYARVRFRKLYGDSRGIGDQYGKETDLYKPSQRYIQHIYLQ